MKRSSGLIIIFIIVVTSAIAGSKDEDAVMFVKTLISKANAENGYTNALRFFQYSATTEKNNPYSYVLSKWGKDAVMESGLNPSDKGKLLPILSNRSGARIDRLWKENKDELFKLFTAEAYNSILKNEIESLIEFRSSPEFAGLMKKLKAKSKKPGVKTIDAAGAVTGWSGYKQLSFWYRRDFEKNDKAVLEILKEIKAHYAQ
jgi:hypothetical protein